MGIIESLRSEGGVLTADEVIGPHPRYVEVGTESTPAENYPVVRCFAPRGDH